MKVKEGDIIRANDSRIRTYVIFNKLYRVRAITPSGHPVVMGEYEMKIIVLDYTIPQDLSELERSLVD
jgi:hypothetical protein